MVRRNASVYVDGEVSGFERAMARAAAAAKGFSKELDTTNDRTALLVQSALAIGPALVPLGAQAVPIMSGLATQAAFAGVAVGTLGLAFSGVGDALKAVNDQAVEPTTAHFTKMKETLDELGPAGGEFVLYLQSIRPELQRLQDTAQAGLLPGAQKGIEELMVLLPEVEQLVGGVAKTLGSLMAEAGDNLNDPRWREFYEYLDTQATPILTDMARTTGNLIEGLANMMMAFDPLTQDFSDAFLKMSRDFAAWSAGLSESEGFANFVDYIETSGPQVWETLGAITNALVELTKAAAPVGQGVLVVLEILSDTLAGIAASKAGPVLIGIAAAMAAVGRAVALGRVVGGSALLGTLGVLGAPTTSANIKKLSAPLADIGTRFQYLGQSSEYASEKTKAARASTQALATTVARTTAVVAGFAVAQTGVADKTGLSNTATLALMGTMAGPYGAAIGGAAGLLLDLAAANDTVAASMDKAKKNLTDSTIDWSADGKELDSVIAKQKEYQQGLEDATDWNKSGSFKGSLAWLSEPWTDANDKQKQLIRDLQASRSSIENYANVLKDAINPEADRDPRLLDMTNEELDRFITELAPVAARLGIDLKETLTFGGPGIDQLADAYRGLNPELDTAAGRSQIVADALAVQKDRTIDLNTVTDMNSDGFKNNTDVLLANIEAMNERNDAMLAAFDAETALQRALDKGKDRAKEKADIEKELREARADGAAERAKIRRDAAEAGADLSGDMRGVQQNLADARARLRVAKTDAQRRAAEKAIRTAEASMSDKQVGASRRQREAQERIQESFDRQAETVARLQERLAEYRNTLDKTTEAGRANRDILSEMAGRWNALDTAAQNVPGKYDKVREKIIEQAMAFGKSREAAERYVDKLGLDIPAKVQTEVMFKDSKAKRAVQDFKKQFDRLDGATSRVFIEARVKPFKAKGAAATGGKVALWADGGYTGNGGKYEPAGVVHKGEFVHTAETTATFRPLFEAIHQGAVSLSDATAIARAQTHGMRGYAGGGYVSGMSIDYDRLAGAVMQARPLYGDVHVKDGTDFRRHLHADQVARSGGGVTF